MTKEKYNEIIDEAYKNYLNNFIPPICPPNSDVQPDYYEPMTKELFIKSIKEKGLRGEEFSEKWGLKIEERNLSYTEREGLFHQNRIVILTKGEKIDEQDFDNVEIPTKLITLEYNGIKTETYE